MTGMTSSTVTNGALWARRNTWALPLLSYEQTMGSMKLFADKVMQQFTHEPAIPAVQVADDAGR